MFTTSMPTYATRELFSFSGTEKNRPSATSRFSMSPIIGSDPEIETEVTVWLSCFTSRLTPPAFAPILSISCACDFMKSNSSKESSLFLRCAALIVSLSLKSSKLNRRTVNEFDPIPAIFSSTYELNPCSTLKTTMKAVTAMIIPSSVRNDRSLCAQIASKASLMVSVKFTSAQNTTSIANASFANYCQDNLFVESL